MVNGRVNISPKPRENMRKMVFLNRYCFFLIFLLFFSSMSCRGKPPSDFFPALTSAAATNQSGSSGNLIDSTEEPSQTPSLNNTTESEKCLAESISNNINIRRGPSGDIIGCCLAQGEKVGIQQVDVLGEWALIQGIEKPAHKGWVKLSYLKIMGDCKMVLPRE